MQSLFLKSNKERKRTSRYLGVCWDKRRNLWWAKINVNGKRHDLGLHQDELSAATAYNEAAKRFGKDILNILKEENR